MSAPRYINDGSFNVAIQNGSTKWNYPFFDRGDSVSFEAIIPYLQDQAYYNRLPIGTTMTINRPGTGSTLCYLVDESNTEDVGNGLLSFTRTFASIPVTRLEGGSLSWGMEVGTVLFLYGFTGSVASRTMVSVRQWPVQWQFEYYLERPYPILTPRVTQTTVDVTDSENITYYDAVYTQQSGNNPPIILSDNFLLFGLGNLIANGTRIAAQDSTVDIYKGNIFVRKTPFVTLLKAQN